MLRRSSLARAFAVTPGRFVLSAALVLVLALVAVAAGCQDPCVTLAQQICNCQLTTLERDSCQNDRIVNQQSSTTITDADRTFCESKLQTCNCAALDRNDLDACGFVPEKTK